MTTSLAQQKNHNYTAVRPPLVKGLPVLGNALDLKGNTGAFLCKQYQEMGSVFRVRVFNHELVVLAGQEANLFFSKEGTKYFTSRKMSQDSKADFDASRILNNMDGSDHAKYRNVLKPGHSLAVLEKQLDRVVATTRQEVATWSTTKPQAVSYLMKRMITRQLGVLLTNYSPHEYVDDLIEVILRRRLPGFLNYLSPYEKAKTRMFELAQKIIVDHTEKSQSSDDRDLIDDLLELFKDDPQFLPTQEDRLLAIVTPLLTGLVTAASTATFLLYALLKQPEILAQATAQANAFFTNNIPTPEGLRSLDVLYRATLEALRLYPVIQALSRTVTTDFEFAGYHIEAEQKVLIATTVPHHLPEFYPNPFEFNINRYSKPREEHRQPGVFAPFGLGSHRCLGMHLSIALIVLSIATILHTVRLEMLPANYQLRIDSIPSPSPDSKFQIRVTQRFE